MPHIHTEPNQHDITVSAYILMWDDEQWKCLVHFHKKADVYMQIGGHIELDETPWQAVAHELSEESGYSLEELDLLQVIQDPVLSTNNITHPAPFSVNTHNTGHDHYHSDMTYAFIASHEPMTATAEGESSDLRWCSVDELTRLATSGEALTDVSEIYAWLVSHIDDFKRVKTETYSLEKPVKPGVLYQRGSAESQRSKAQ